MRGKTQRGQIALVTLLTMVVLLTSGLSLASRTTRDATQSQEQIESSRTFNAAGTGIDQALSSDLASLAAQGQVPIANLDGERVGGTLQVQAQSELAVTANEGQSLQVTIHPSGLPSATGSIQLHWGSATACSPTPPSLIATIYSGSGATSRSRTFAVSGVDCGLADGFILGSSSGVSGYAFTYSIPLAVGDRRVLVRPVYGATNLLVRGNGVSLPSQVYQVTSVGNSVATDQRRTIEVLQTPPQPPDQFGYALVSGETLVN